MLNSPTSMSITMAALRRLLSNSRSSLSGKVPIPTTLTTRNLSHLAIQPRVVQVLSASNAIPIVSTSTVENVFLRGYATTTAKKGTTSTRKTTTKKKTATKKKAPAKKATKKAKKKTAAKKKPVKKRKVAAKPKKPARPDVIKVPSSRGISGYIVFLQTQLKSIPGPGAAGRLSDAVKEWKALSDTEKQTWNTRAQSVNASRKQEHDNMIARLSPSQIKEENSKRRLLAKNFKASKANTRLIKDPNAPKKPLTGYLRFFQEHYTPGVPIPEAAKEASRLWKAMSETEKRPYQQAYNTDKERYAREKAAYYSS